MSDNSNNLHQHRVLRNSPHPSEPSQEFEAEATEYGEGGEFDERFRPRRNLRKEFPLADPSPALAGPGVRPKRANSNAQLLSSPPQGQEAEENVYKSPARSSSSRRDSTQSLSSNSKDRKKKDKQLARERKNKIDAFHGKIEAGHIHDDEEQTFITTTTASAATTFQSISFVERSVNEQSSAPLFPPVMEKIYDSSAGVNSTRNGSVDSLIFPTRTAGAESTQHAEMVKRREISRRLNDCEERAAKRFVLPLMGNRIKLDLSGTSMTSEDDIPVKDICNTALGNVLQKLLLRKNKLKSIPPSIVQYLPALTVLDLQQCSLHELPEVWNLPKLKTLDVSCNHLTDFPGENMLRGLPELTNLLLKDNDIADITLPSDQKLLSKLRKLDLGYNRITSLRDELDGLVSLSHLLLEHNFFTVVPMRVCLMKSLRELNVGNNESIHQPPTHDCGRGLCAMRRYWECLRREEESKREVEANLRKRASRAAKSMSLPPKMSVSVNQNETHASLAERFSTTASTVTASSGSSPKPAARLPISERSQSSPIPSLITTPKARDTINDTLKVIVVGMEFAGKTSIIKKLIDGESAEIPGPDSRTVGLDIYDWYPKTDKRFEDIDSRIETMECVECDDVNVKFSVWDFAGQHVYHATHELFFSKHALYIIVWDMGRGNQDTYVPAPSKARESGAFALEDSSDESEDDSVPPYTDANRQADLALAADIDDKVQFWVDCIQNTCPGAVILPVASFADSFTTAEANRRCKNMQERLLRHEEQRVKGIRDRLKELKENYHLNDVAANHLRHLLCPSNRPKLIFGKDAEAVAKVSCTEYSGFEKLTRRVVDVATGRNKFGADTHLFCGHVGARIPRMRLDVRETVRMMRKKFRVVEWGYFTSVLLEQGQTSKDDIVDALLFLSSTGELSFFGSSPEMRNSESGHKVSDSEDWPSSELEEEIALSLDTATISTRMTNDETASTFDDRFPSISQFVFLNPRWLVAAVACVLRHDLDVQIRERRRDAQKGITTPVPRTANSHTDGHINCPVITAEDAYLLWRHDHTTNKAAGRAMEYSNNESVSPFDFLQTLLTRFGVFVPINLDIDTLLFGGMKYSDFSRDVIDDVGVVRVDGEKNEAHSTATFFLPCLLGPAEPGDVWTYKTSDSWKTTLCHSLLFPDGVPTGLMERLTSTVLSVVHTLAERSGAGIPVDEAPGSKKCTFEGKLKAKEILCWQSAFYLKLGSQVNQPDGTEKESVIELFVTLAKPDSPLCVGSQHMVCGMRRLIITGRGPAGDGGRKIWTGGYLLVLKCCQRVITEYGGAEYEKHGFCPKCLAELDVKKASYWTLPRIRAAVGDREEEIHCQYGHSVETRLVAGPNDSLRPSRSLVGSHTAVKVNSLLHAVVVVGLWDGRSRDIVRVGSGFIVDKKRGLIVTAAHTLINVWDDRSTPFGEDYYGLSLGRVVIGVVPAEEENGKAVFRYFAQILTKDPNLEQGNCRVDACVLQIVTRLENDVAGSPEDWQENQPEVLLLNSQKSMKSERLPALKLLHSTSKIEREEQVRIIGYNQGGEGLLSEGASLNRNLDFAIGYFVSTYSWAEDGRSNRTDRFKPKEELIVMCPTIGGHSGGPCVNLRGEVIGILSRADSAESQRCYLVPWAELKSLISRAKKLL